MRVLAIDTATDVVVTGMAEVAGTDSADTTVEVLAERAVSDGRRHAEILTTLIGEVLGEAALRRNDVDAVVVGCGPGPFTGLRVGMATAAAFGDALGLPVYGVCSLDAIAASGIRAQERVDSLLVVTDARRREIYWALYVDGRRESGPEVDAPATVIDALAETSIDMVLGSPTHASLFDGPVGEVSAPTAAGLIDAAGSALTTAAAPAALVPLYLRRPDATEPARRNPVSEVSR